MLSPIRYKAWIHFAGWLIFFLAPFLFSPGPGLLYYLSDPTVVIPTIVRNLLLAGLFYFNLFYLTPVILKQKGLGFFLFVIVLSVMVVSFINWQVHETFTDSIFRKPEPPVEHFGNDGPGGFFRPRPMMLAGPLFSSLLMTLIVVSISTSLVLWGDWEQARIDERERQLQKVASELAVLKLQISPHFLFNTLNNIRWLVRSKSDQAEEAVIRLSQLLRYILYQAHHDEVYLEKEVENLRDYISLQSMRLVNQQALDFLVEGELKGRMIVPLLFLPVVENVFKYGDFNGSFQNQIHIRLVNDRVVLLTRNKVLPKNESERNIEESGIGLFNIKRRLALHYPDLHLLSYSEEDGIFKLEMEIILG